MSQITPDQLQALLKFAAARLGMTPEQLAATVQSGNTHTLENKLGSDAAAQVEALAGNPAQLEQLMQSPKAKALLNQLLGGK